MIWTPPGSPRVSNACEAPGQYQAQLPLAFNLSSASSNASSGASSPSASDSGGDFFSTPAEADQVAVAKHNRQASIGVAQRLVHAKELESGALVEIKRMSEEHATARCRIVEQERSKRFEHMASVAKLSISEREQTEREREQLRAATEREEIAARMQLEDSWLRSVQGFCNVTPWALGSFVGALSARVRTVTPTGVVAAGGLTHPPHSALLSRYMPSLVLLYFLRYVWQTSRHNSQLLGKLAPVLRAACQGTLRRTLGAILHNRHCQSALKMGGLGVVDNDASRDPSDQGLSDCHPRTSAVDSPRRRSSMARGPGDLALRHCLANWRLGEYAGGLERWGYDLEVLRKLREPDDVEDLLRLVDCKPEHSVIFRRALQSWGAAGASVD